MAALSIQVPYPVFYDRDGQPLDNGNIYIGVANLDPVTNPLQVYYDDALTITASQPLVTSNGYIYRNGTPAQIYVDAVNFSITVNDSKNTLVYSFPDGTGIASNASGVTYNEGGVGAVNRTVQAKLRESASVEDFGAVGDGITDDTVAINAAVASAEEVTFTAGKTYLTTSRIIVPTTCYRIDGAGAYMKGPGYNSGVDGFYFTGFQQGPSTYPTWHQSFRSRNYSLPGLTAYRYGISIYNAAFLPIECELISFCTSAIRIEATGGANNWAVQNIFRCSLIVNCTNAIDLVCAAASVEGIQGITMDIDYISGCNNGILGTFDSPAANINYNIFKVGNLDGNGANNNPTFTYANAVNFNVEPTGNINTFLFASDAINMNPSTGASPYINVGNEVIIQAGRFIGRTFDPFYYENFLAGGYRTTARPAFDSLVIYVDQSVAVSGNGSSSSPYKTVAEALTALFEMDGFGRLAVIRLAAGTYSTAISVDTETKGNGNWELLIAGTNTVPGDVILTGGIEVTSTVVTLQDLTVTTSGLNAKNNGYVRLNRVYFGAVTNAHINAETGATVEIGTDYTISGGAEVHMQTGYGGQILCMDKEVTLTGTPAFTSYYAYATKLSYHDYSGTTFVGSATGVRALVELNSCINTNGGGATFLPGNAAVVTATGGLYV